MNMLLQWQMYGYGCLIGFLLSDWLSLRQHTSPLRKWVLIYSVDEAHRVTSCPSGTVVSCNRPRTVLYQLHVSPSCLCLCPSREKLCSSQGLEEVKLCMETERRTNVSVVDIKWVNLANLQASNLKVNVTFFANSCQEGDFAKKRFGIMKQASMIFHN